MVPQRPDDAGCALDAQQDAVTGIADPAQVEVAPLAAGDDGEHGAAFLVRPVEFDPLQQRTHLRILESGVDVLTDTLEEKRKVFRLRPDGGPADGRELAVELFQDFLRTGLHRSIIAVAPAAFEKHHQPPCDGPADEDAEVHELGKCLQWFHQG